MPRFAAIRNVLRGSKDTTNTVLTSTSTTPTSTPTPVPTSSFPPIVFTSLHDRPGLISLAEAQHTPDIVYHSVSSIPDPTPEPEVEFPAHNSLGASAGWTALV